MRRSLLATLLLLPLAGCTPLLGLDEQDAALEESNGIALSLAAERTDLAPGDTLRLTARIANTGSQPVRLQFSSGCQVFLYVENSAGKVVFPEGGSYICTLALTELKLAAGEEKEYHRQTVLPAGEYRAYARMDARRGEQRLSLRTRDLRVVVR